MDPADESELLSQLQEGEFWVEEEEFLQEFDEVTVGFPITEAGHLQSLYSGKGEACTQGEAPITWDRPLWGCHNPHGLCLMWLGLSGHHVPLGAPGHSPRPRP